MTEEDADRVWSCVENAVRVMAEAEEETDVEAWISEACADEVAIIRRLVEFVISWFLFGGRRALGAPQELSAQLLCSLF